MKKVILFILIFGLGFSATAQKKVNPRKVRGDWELFIDVKSELEKKKEDLGVLEGAFAEVVTDFVDEVLQETILTFHFDKNGTYTFEVDFDGNINKEYGHWRVDKSGKLILSNLDYDDFEINEEDGWMFYKGNLVLVDDSKMKKNVYLKKI